MKKRVVAGAVILAVLGAALSVAYATTVSGSPAVSNVMDSGAQISWTTDVASDSQVNYGTSPTNLYSYSASRCDLGGNILAHCVNLTGLAYSTLYYYKVVSCVSGSLCGESPVNSFTSGSSMGSIPAAPSNLRLNGTPTTSQIPLAWNDNSNNEDKWNIDRSLAGANTWTPSWQLTTANLTTYTDTTVAAGTSYDYRVQACHSGYGCSEYTSLTGVSSAAAPDTGAPTTPTGISATVNSLSQINISWTASTDNVAVTGYKLFRNNTLVATITTVNYTDSSSSGIVASTTYSYYVKAIDAAGNESASSATVSATTPPSSSGGTDTTAPSTPTGLSATVSSASQIVLVWNASTDNVAVTGYKIFRNGTFLFSVTTTNLTETGLSAGTTYSYYVKAIDAAGNESPASGTVSATTLTSSSGNTGGTADTSAPTAPTGLVATKDAYNEVDLSWAQSTDNVGVTGYAVYRSANAVWTMIGGAPNTTYADLTVSPSSSYYYAIKAYDAAGNGSATSAPLFLNTPAVPPGATTTTYTDTTPPAISLVRPFNIMGPGAQIAWTTDDPSDSRVMYGTQSSTGMLYPYHASSVCEVGGLVTSHCANLTNLSLATVYYYRVLSKNASSLETISQEYTFFSATSTFMYYATTTPGTIATTSATVSMFFGTPYCEGLIGRTPFTLSISPYGSAFLRVSMLSPSIGSTTLTAGTYPLQNGAYHWEIVPYTGYTLSSYGKTSDDLILNYSCAGAATTTLLSTVTLASTTPIAAPTVGAIPNAPTDLHMSGMPTGSSLSLVWTDNSGIEDKYNIERKLTTESAYSSSLFKQLSANTTSYTDDAVVPGVFYDYRVQACLSGSGCSAYARLSGVMVPTPTMLAQMSGNMATSTTMVTPFATMAPTAPSVDTIQTVIQYQNYCADPLHKTECQTYATTKVLTSVAAAPVPAPIVSPDMFAVVQSAQPAGALPAGATNPQELQSACTQTQYAASCADLFVAAGVSDRQSADQVAARAVAARAESEKVLVDRMGARAFLDSDNDGITDYDEVNIYHTDYKKADTNSDGVPDGAQLLLGTDPLAKVLPPSPGTPSRPATSTAAVPQRIVYEDPKFSGDIKPTLLAITAVAAVTTEIPNTTNEPKATTTKVKLEGKALPNSFVTLFVYSEPIVVTVKADASGSWTYTMDKELSDGHHEVYSAITDVGGRILAKSEPLPFVKEAAAVSFGSATLLPAATPEAPGFFSGGSLYAMIIVLVGVLGLAFFLIGWTTRRNRSVTLPGVIDEQKHDQ